MKSARFYAPNDFRIEEIPIPKVGENDILVKVAGCGVCHSDLHIIRGELPLPRTPITLGHEVGGYVEKVGKCVEGVNEGDKVLVYGGWGCGNCDLCISSEEQLCNVLNWLGVGVDGGYAEYLRVPSKRYLVPLRDLDPAKSAPLTDAGLTAYRAVRKACEGLPVSETIVIIGVGGLGQFGVQFAKLRGYKVVALDISSKKIEIAKKLGADLALNLREGEFFNLVSEFTNGKNAGAVIDFVGTDETLRTAVNFLGKRGRLVLVGIGGGQVSMTWNPILPSEVSYTTVYWGSILELREVVELAERGRIQIKSEKIGFDDLLRTFERMERGELESRVVLCPD
ncbi:MAG: NAD(P)-dependent alcohol dehydrogenase [Archaeoglobaceae archaeon]|nr:NAD(P)-dependent alcohol dehydrogenase [Archaeoglobaceae archaeon]MDW8117356.1 NAD(P)-dependent alcohol dehydrogenase [Archaeoglobaceae archaeon]